MKNKRAQSIFSIKWKVIIMMLAAVVVTAGICIGFSLPVVNKDITTLTHNYMEDLALNCGDKVDGMYQTSGEAALAPDALGDSVGNVAITGMSSSYTYVVSADGTMLYHPSADKIGQPVENAAVKQVIGEIQGGKHPTCDVITYNFKGSDKYAAYYVGGNESFIIVVTADAAEAKGSITEITVRCLVGALFAIILCAIVGYFVTSMIVAPIKTTTAEVERLADLDFTVNKNVKYKKTNDETRIMMEAIQHLREQLCDTVMNITGETAGLNTASADLSRSVNETASAVEQVENAIQEIADGATSQAQETLTATQNVVEMGKIIQQAGVEVQALIDNANEMRSSSDQALITLDKLGEINQKTKSAVDEVYQQTTNTNQSVHRIMQATDIITGIAEQTNLLSLNASIEAARAGEAGKGFAVVASEIQKLAEQSNQSAAEISVIIRDLISDSEKSVATMNEIREVIELQDQHVAETGDAFKQVKEGIDKSVEGVNRISQRTAELDGARETVTDIVNSLTAIAQENAASAQETSASAAEVASIMSDIADNSKIVHTSADTINQDMARMRTE